MKKRYRQHINPLKMTALVERPPVDVPDGPAVEVELGCADARFLIERARGEPDRLFWGLDIREEFLLEGRAAVQALGLDNVRLEATNLIVDAGHLFAPGRVERFFINFPDPWFKRRQHNRRWLTAATLAHLVAALQPRGEIFMQSDVWSVALDALALLEAHPELINAAGEWRFVRGNPFGVKSTREMICERDALPIWRMLFWRDYNGIEHDGHD